MHQSITPSLSQTIWPRWASRQLLAVLIVQTLLPVTFGYSLSSEDVVMRELRRWKRQWRRSLTRSQKGTFMGPSRSYWNSTSALQPEEITSKCPYEESLETYLMILVSYHLKIPNQMWDFIRIWLLSWLWCCYSSSRIFGQVITEVSSSKVSVFLSLPWRKFFVLDNIYFCR